MSDKLELIKANCIEGYDRLYLDKTGKPYIVKPAKVQHRHNSNDEQYIWVNVKGNMKGMLLKKVIAKTLLGYDGDYIYYKDKNNQNCTVYNLITTDKYAPELEHNNFICQCCGKAVRIRENNYKQKYCSKCLKKGKKQEKMVNLYENLVQNRRYFKMTVSRKIILDKLREGKNYSQIAKELGVSRQAISNTIQSIQKSINKKKQK